MRIQRALARAGVTSRRDAERLVAEGRVRVNGAVAVIGQDVGPEDALEVDGRLVAEEEPRTYLLYKPLGAVSTVRDPQGRPTVLEGMPEDVRLYPVGRLDKDTTGALLVTNDGELASRLMHPRSKVPKVYEALVDGRVSAATIRRLRNGVELEDGPTLPATVERMERVHPGGTWLRLELTEGRNRQVRRMAAAVGHPVLRLHRSRYAGVGLARMRPGAWRPLSQAELERLAALVGLER
ncbi:MAG TPA: pseudouridine synthase [Miltoncostaeaceae bacterium]|nr:pseudouridine synthase [Miltoncostaeaceae bacterium]